jgi:hypothetical protein
MANNYTDEQYQIASMLSYCDLDEFMNEDKLSITLESIATEVDSKNIIFKNL